MSEVSRRTIDPSVRVYTDASGEQQPTPGAAAEAREMTTDEVAQLHTPWTIIRLLLNQGGVIPLDHANKSYEQYSTRLDGAARERVELVTAVFRNALLATPVAGAGPSAKVEEAKRTLQRAIEAWAATDKDSHERNIRAAEVFEVMDALVLAARATPPSEETKYEWWCPNCSIVVPPEAVTYGECHDIRNGGCGERVGTRPVRATPPTARGEAEETEGHRIYDELVQRYVGRGYPLHGDEGDGTDSGDPVDWLDALVGALLRITEERAPAPPAGTAYPVVPGDTPEQNMLRMLIALQKLRPPEVDVTARPVQDERLAQTVFDVLYKFWPDFALHTQVLASRDEWRETARELGAQARASEAPAGTAGEDTARLDWWEAHPHDVRPYDTVNGDHIWWYRDQYALVCSGTSLREALDAARRATTEAGRPDQHESETVEAVAGMATSIEGNDAARRAAPEGEHPPGPPDPPRPPGRPRFVA